MEKDLKDILLKDLCGRLPYGVKVGTTDNDGSLENVWDTLWFNTFTEDVKLTHSIKDADKIVDISETKPYLFPLSSMTEEQYYELQNCSSYDCLEHMELVKTLRECTDFTHWPLYEYRVIDWFNKNHVDYRGLIPMGLAKDATGLNIY